MALGLWGALALALSNAEAVPAGLEVEATLLLVRLLGVARSVAPPDAVGRGDWDALADLMGEAELNTVALGDPLWVPTDEPRGLCEAEELARAEVLEDGDPVELRDAQVEPLREALKDEVGERRGEAEEDGEREDDKVIDGDREVDGEEEADALSDVATLARADTDSRAL